MKNFEYCKESYLHEVSRANELRRSVNLPAGLTVILAGALFSLFKSYSFSATLGVFDFCIIVVGFTSAVCLLGAMLFMVIAHVNYEYAHVPTSKEIMEYKRQYVDYLKKVPGGRKKAEHIADLNVVKYLELQFADNAHINAMNNNSKSGYLHEVNIFLVSAVFSLLLTGLLVLGF